MPKLSPSESPALLSVGEFARRSGVTAATLRTWETRHGFPEPARLAGGHRRYREDDVAVLAQVLRLRRGGLSVEAAIATARNVAKPTANSFYAALRAHNPELRPQTLTKAVLSALTAALEDEYCARAERPVLLGAFEQANFYRRVEPRWRELARTAECAVVFADFDRLQSQPQRPVEVPLAEDAPLRREWALVCDAPGYAACVTGWELPEPVGVPDAERLFETVWTLDARAVREASRVGVGLLATESPALARTLDNTLTRVALPPSADLQQATALFSRVLSYAQNATRRASRNALHNY